MIKIILLALLAAALTACKTTKYVDRVKTVVDSTLIEQNTGLQKTLHETVINYEKQVSDLSKTRVEFDTVTVTDTVPVKIYFTDEGKIKSIEGRVKSITQDLNEKTGELNNISRLADSLSVENEKKEARLSKKQDTIIKTVTRRVYSWWLFGLVLVGGLLLEYKFRLITRLLILFKWTR